MGKESTILLINHLQDRKHRFLKKNKTKTKNTSTAVSNTSSSCSDAGKNSAKCCTATPETCCSGNNEGKIVCWVSDLKFILKDCGVYGERHCSKCMVKNSKNNNGKNYRKCGDCYTCPDGTVAYKCLDYYVSC